MSQEQYILGIGDSHDAGACLIDFDGNIICAINEERLSRRKLDAGMPYRSIDEILARSGIQPSQIAHVALATHDFLFAWHFRKTHYEVRGNLMKQNALSFFFNLFFVPLVLIYRTGIFTFLGKIKRPGKSGLKKFLAERNINAPITVVEHHTAHAASAYFTNDKKQSLVITMDTCGDRLCETVGLGENGHMTRLFSQKVPDSPTNLYSRVTQALGFQPARHEGKTLGLAAFGNPEKLAAKFRKLVRYTGGRFSCKWKLGNMNAGTAYIKKITAGEKREDIAAALQRVTEETVLRFISDWVRKTGVPDLACAGGFFANVLVNQKILELPGVKSLFIHPNMGDGGLGVGAAYSILSDLKKIEPKPLNNSYLGFEYSEEEILEAIKTFGLPYEKISNLPRHIASLLKDGKIVGICRGRMEYGPRALGNRTILANPADQTINDWLNKRLNRTEFMPFAPVVCAEDAADCYEDTETGKYPATFMTITLPVKKTCRELAPAVCHVDGTARPQIIEREENPFYYDVIQEFKRMTGIPVLINTSFNMHEEPIVCSPEDAIRSLKHGAVDVLVLGDFAVVQSHSLSHVPLQQIPTAKFRQSRRPGAHSPNPPARDRKGNNIPRLPLHWASGNGKNLNGAAHSKVAQLHGKE